MRAVEYSHLLVAELLYRGHELHIESRLVEWQLTLYLQIAVASYGPYMVKFTLDYEIVIITELLLKLVNSVVRESRHYAVDKCVTEYAAVLTQSMKSLPRPPSAA